LAIFYLSLTVPHGNSCLDHVEPITSFRLLTRLLTISIRITTALPNHVVEGTLFAACSITNLIAINSAPASSNASSGVSSQPGDYHVIPVSQIQNFQFLSPATESNRVHGSELAFEGSSPSISKLDLDALKAREEVAIRKMKEFDATRGKGVTKEAQDIFDWFARTYVFELNFDTSGQ
jgi:protein LSM12